MVDFKITPVPVPSLIFTISTQRPEGDERNDVMFILPCPRPAEVVVLSITKIISSVGNIASVGLLE